MTVYDLIPIQEPAVMNAIRPHRRVVYRRYLARVRAARGVIAISAPTAADVAGTLGVSPDRIRVVPPFVRAPDASPAFSGDEEGGGRDRELPTFLIVGVPGPHKRIELALDAFTGLVERGIDARLVLAGVHPSTTRANLRQAVGRRGLGPQVRFADHVSDGELRALYADSILLATSTVEGFGLPPVESVLSGGTVVATPTPAYLDSLGDAAVYATDETQEALTAAMEASVGQRPSPAARDRVAARFGAAPVAQALVQAYRDLANIE